MSALELAARLKVHPSRVGQIEHSEVSGSIQLATLTRAARALECQVVYALVPVRSLEDTVMRRAWLKAGWALDDFLSYDGSNLEEIVEGPETLERHEVLALEWVDRRGLWTDAAVQLAARVVPPPPDPPPASRSGAP
jgi:transcriptional regulator with XRE-family HTH domain